jgi:hypothetical protein
LVTDAAEAKEKASECWQLAFVRRKWVLALPAGRISGLRKLVDYLKELRRLSFSQDSAYCGCTSGQHSGFQKRTAVHRGIDSTFYFLHRPSPSSLVSLSLLLGGGVSLLIPALRRANQRTVLISAFHIFLPGLIGT